MNLIYFWKYKSYLIIAIGKDLETAIHNIEIDPNATVEIKGLVRYTDPFDVRSAENVTVIISAFNGIFA